MMGIGAKGHIKNYSVKINSHSIGKSEENFVQMDFNFSSDKLLKR